MRELRVIGLESDSSHVVCADASTGEKFRLPADDKLRAASRGDIARLGQIEIEMDSQLRPREIQARIRAGASVQEVADEASIPVAKVESFAYPVLLERSRAAEMAQGGHPVRDNGPAVPTLSEIVTLAFRARGHNIDDATWDAWRDEDNHWVAQLQWQAGRTTNAAHWRYQPDAHGGTIVALDDTAFDLIDPDFGRPLRGLAPVALHSAEQLELSDDIAGEADRAEPSNLGPTTLEVPASETSNTDASDKEASDTDIIDAETTEVVADSVESATGTDRSTPPVSPRTAPHSGASHNKDKRGKPALPSWDDVLLGVRSSGR